MKFYLTPPGNLVVKIGRTCKFPDTFILCFIQQSKIANEMNTKVHLEGCLNGHPFTVEGEGRGKPFE